MGSLHALVGKCEDRISELSLRRLQDHCACTLWAWGEKEGVGEVVIGVGVIFGICSDG